MDLSATHDWSLSFHDLEFLSSLPQSVCLEAGLQLCSVRSSGRFIEEWSDLNGKTVNFVASQLDMQAARLHRRFSDRTARRYRLEVARHLGLSRTQTGHRTDVDVCLRETVCPNGGSASDMLDQSFAWFRDRRLLPPAEGIVSRLVGTARREFLGDLLASVSEGLSPTASAALETSLTDSGGEHGFQRLKGDVGAATLDNVLEAADRLAFIQSLELPFDLVSGVDLSWIKMLTRRVDGETASEMRRHNQAKRLGLFAIYLMSRRSELIDGLVDLLIEVVHRIGTKSRRNVIGRIAANIEKVHGKERLLVDIATTAMSHSTDTS